MLIRLGPFRGISPAIPEQPAYTKTVVDEDKPLIPDGVQYDRIGRIFGGKREGWACRCRGLLIMKGEAQ